MALLHLLVFCGLLAGLREVYPTTVHDLHFVDGGEIALPYEFSPPYSYRAPAISRVIEGTLDVGPRHRELHFRADDCLEWLSVGGRSLLRGTCEPCQHCAPRTLTIPDKIPDGTHKLRLAHRNLGDRATLDIREAHGFAGKTWWCLVAAIIVLVLVRRDGLAMHHWWIFNAALVGASAYFIVTDMWERQHDIIPHREYIDHLLEHHALPHMLKGWETWQPPLYYALAALWAKAGSSLSMFTYRWVQVFAAVIFVATVGSAVMVWRRFGLASRSGWLGLVLFALIPAHLFISPRINNDVLMPLLGMATMVSMWRYGLTTRVRDLGVVSLVLLLALVNKTSSLSLCAGVGLYFLWVEYQERRSRRELARRVVILVAPSVAWMSLWMVRSWQHTGSPLYSNTGGMERRFLVPNTLAKYLYLDVRALLVERRFDSGGGELRESLPASTLSSMFLGEFWWGNLNQTVIAALLLTAIPVVALILVGLCTPVLRDRQHPWGLASLLLLAHSAFLLAYNLRYSHAPNEDARLWAPVFFPGALLWSWGLESVMRCWGGRLRIPALVVTAVFLMLLCVFLGEALLKQV